MLRLLFCGSIFFCIISCRKKIEHEVGKEVSYSAVIYNDGSTWNKISPIEIDTVNALEIFGNEMYFGGNFSGSAYLGKMNTSGDFFNPAMGNFTLNGINDLETFNGKLIAAGNFSFAEQSSGLISKNVMSLSESGIIEPIPFSTNDTSVIYHLNLYNDELLVAGKFAPESGSLCVSGNRDIYNGVSCSGYGSGYVVYATADNNGAGLYSAFGTAGLPNINYPSKTPFDEIYDVCYFNNVLYFFGKFQNNAAVMSKAGTGWKIHGSITSLTGSRTYGGFKVIGNEFFVFGNGLLLNGEQTSNVLKLGSQVWTPIGELHVEVRDIIYFNGRLYAATTDGIYEF